MQKSEIYITIGEHELKGKGIAKEATKLLLNYAFDTLDLNKVYLFTEKIMLLLRSCLKD